MAATLGDLEATIKDLKVYSTLSLFEPRVVGTIPLGVAINGSDIDVVCESDDLENFIETVSEHYWGKPGFEMSEPTINGIQSAVCRFTHNSLPIEIFCQSIPVHMQFGYRHFVIEQRVLGIHGDRARREIKDYKMEGMKTEEAFVKFLGLSGDPYEALLSVDNLSDDEIRELRPVEPKTIQFKKRKNSEVSWS